MAKERKASLHKVAARLGRLHSLARYSVNNRTSNQDWLDHYNNNDTNNEFLHYFVSNSVYGSIR
jgi:hypothetical protein